MHFDSYTPACQKLITQYKELVESLRDIVPDVKDFMRKYQARSPCFLSLSLCLLIGY